MDKATACLSRMGLQNPLHQWLASCLILTGLPSIPCIYPGAIKWIKDPLTGICMQYGEVFRPRWILSQQNPAIRLANIPCLSNGEPRQRMSDKEEKSKVLAGSINACTCLPRYLDNVCICARPDLPLSHPHVALIKTRSLGKVPKRKPFQRICLLSLITFPFEYGALCFDPTASLSGHLCGLYRSSTFAT